MAIFTGLVRFNMNLSEESCSSAGGPSLNVPNLQQARVAVSVPTVVEADEKSDLCEPSESSPLIKGDGKSSRLCRCGGWNWGQLIATVCLWVTYLFVSAAYSIIGPFFPSEV